MSADNGVSAMTLGRAISRGGLLAALVAAFVMMARGARAARGRPVDDRRRRIQQPAIGGHTPLPKPIHSARDTVCRASQRLERTKSVG
jgi:Mg-chelatase subunit ChlD